MLQFLSVRGRQVPVLGRTAVLAGHLTVFAAFCRSEMGFVTRDQVFGSNAADYNHLTP